MEWKGQAYAFRQAGLTMGVVLLLVLTITVELFRTRVSVYCNADSLGIGRLDYPLDCDQL